MACHPRIAHMLLKAKEDNAVALASDIAAILEKVPYVRYQQTITITERVFAPGESSVFLHCVGKGWLMENRLSTVCFRRVC